jgi:hypothetical protein
VAAGGYRASFARLAQSGTFEIDTFPAVVDGRAHVAMALAHAAQQRPGFVSFFLVSVVLFLVL